MDIKKRFSQLLTELASGLYEKDSEIALALLAAIAGESVLLLGPPGVAKSMIARRIKSAFREATAFEYLMSRFSTPDDIFGPVSISKLKQSDSYERSTAGFLPEADIVFLDEIWKAGPAILNTLLTIVNEKTFRNGNTVCRVPMKLLIGASNELPAEGEGLEALWDRFLVRMECGCVKDEENFYNILLEETSDDSLSELPIDSELLITASEYAQWQDELRTIGVEREVLECITSIRCQLPQLRVASDGDENAVRVHNVYVSDRRWKHIVRLLRASAFVQGRRSVTLADIPVLIHCLWNEPEEIDSLQPVVVSAVLSPLRREIEKVDAAVGVELKNVRVKQVLSQAAMQGDTRDENKQIFDNFYYRIDNYGTGNTYIFLVDYRHLPALSHNNPPMDGVIYADPTNTKRTIIRSMSDSQALIDNGLTATRVKLYRGQDDIYLNGVKYPIHLLPRGQMQAMPNVSSKMQADSDYEAAVESLASKLRELTDSISADSLFVSAAFTKELDRQKQALNRQIALIRINLQKLLYD